MSKDYFFLKKVDYPLNPVIVSAILSIFNKTKKIMKKLNKESTAAVILNDDMERAYRRLSSDRLGLSGIPGCLKPQKNIWTGEITITNPKGQKEVWKEVNTLVGKKYRRLR